MFFSLTLLFVLLIFCNFDLNLSPFIDLLLNVERENKFNK